jgi:hypothetical protein
MEEASRVMSTLQEVLIFLSVTAFEIESTRPLLGYDNRQLRGEVCNLDNLLSALICPCNLQVRYNVQRKTSFEGTYPARRALNYVPSRALVKHTASQVWSIAAVASQPS